MSPKVETPEVLDTQIPEPEHLPETPENEQEQPEEETPEQEEGGESELAKLEKELSDAEEAKRQEEEAAKLKGGEVSPEQWNKFMDSFSADTVEKLNTMDPEKQAEAIKGLIQTAMFIAKDSYAYHRDVEDTALNEVETALTKYKNLGLSPLSVVERKAIRKASMGSAKDVEAIKEMILKSRVAELKKAKGGSKGGVGGNTAPAKKSEPKKTTKESEYGYGVTIPGVTNK